MKRLLLLTVSASLFWSMSQAQELEVPEGYPPEYEQIIRDAMEEDRLVVYSNVSAANWQPFLDLAQEKFPWLTIETSDINTMWERYYAESAAGTRTADIMLTTAPESWLEFHDRGQVAQYESPESGSLPDWAEVLPGVYAASADPFILAYNRHFFEDGEPPNSISEVAAALTENPDLAGRITAYDPERSTTGRAVWMAWAREHPEGWDLIETFGPALRPETSAGTMREKVTTGEYVVALLTSGAGIRAYEEPAVKALAGWTYPVDTTPVLVRSVAITEAASSPNSARLFLDLLLSREGQLAFAEGGQTPYRDDILPADAPFLSLTGVRDAVGEENIIFVVPNPYLVEERDEFLARWREAREE